MRPRRLPGWRASGVPGVPGLTPGAMGPGPARKGGDSGSRFTEVFRVDMRPLRHAHGVQRHRGRQTRGDALPHVDRERFTGREPPAVSELGHGVVDDLAVEPRRDLLAQHPIQLAQVHNALAVRFERPPHGDAHLVVVLVLGGGLPELGGVSLGRPICPPHAVRRAKLNDTRKIADRHRWNTRAALALNANGTGLPGVRPRSRAASSVTTATSSTPTSAVTCTAPPRWCTSRVTRPQNTLRADDVRGSRLTRMSVGGTARMAGPDLSVRAAISTFPTRTCFRSPGAPTGSSIRNRFSGVTGERRPSARARTSSAQR